MKMKILAAAVLTAAFTLGQAQAATLSATSTNGLISNFSIDFNDSNADGLLQFTEVTNFSGVTASGTIYKYLASVPTIASISDHDGGAGGQSCVAACTSLWRFSVDADELQRLGAGNAIWTYEITGLTPVPVPASLPLLVVGLGGLGLMARRKLKVN